MQTITPGNVLNATGPFVATELEPELEFTIAAAIAQNDQAAIYRAIPRIASQPAAAIELLRIRLSAHFKRDFSRREFNGQLKLEQASRKAARHDVLPVVQINNRSIGEITKPALSALQASNDPPNLFVRGGKMVYVAVDEERRPAVVPVSESYLRGRIGRVAEFYRCSDSGDTKVLPPVETVRDIMALPIDELALPALLGVAEAPTMRQDGTVIDEPGYDPASRMYFHPGPGLENMILPEDPGTDDIAEAVAMIDEAVGEFPYADVASKANLFGLLLTPIVRPAIAGCVPLAVIDAPTQGTGKSLLADVLSTIITGRPAHMQPYPLNEEEMRKVIGSALLGGRPIISFDNVESTLKSPNLASVLTAKTHEDRILGVSENMVVPNRATWLCTGNNVQLAGDMPRRCYQIRMDPQSSKPFMGRTFKHPRLLEWVHEHRAELLHALLTITRAWFQAGKPRTPERVLGTFEEWHRTVGGILAYAGIEGFLANIDALHDQADDTALQWERFLIEIGKAFDGDAGFTAADVAKKIRAGADTRQPSLIQGDEVALFDALPDTLADVDFKKPKSLERALGRSFAKRVERRYGAGQVRIVRGSGDMHTKIASWIVVTG